MSSSAKQQAILEVFGTFDRRLTTIESDMADAAAFGDEHAKQLVLLQELYVSIDKKLDDLATMMGNYVDATKELRNATRTLHSEVREKLKAASG